MRHITLLLENGKQSDLDIIKEWCIKNNIEFNYRYSRNNGIQYNSNEEIAPLYYFTIFSDTKHYLELKNIIGDKLMTTDFADICNIADSDDNFEIKFKDLINLLSENQHLELKVNKEFLNFIKEIDNIELLNEIKNYSGHMTPHQRKMLDDRIKIVDGNIDDVHEEFLDDMLSVHCDVKTLREKTGMTRREFCNYFEIPYRTVEDWEAKKSICSTYLFKLMEDKLKTNGFVNS